MFAAIALVTVLLLAAPLALAGGDDASEKGKAKAEERRRDAREGNETDDEPRAKLHGAKEDRSAQRRAFHEAFVAKLREWREAWKENATAIRAACHAVVLDHDNASKEERRAWAHCIRDGYHQFFQALKLERKAWKDEWKASRDA